MRSLIIVSLLSTALVLGTSVYALPKTAALSSNPIAFADTEDKGGKNFTVDFSSDNFPSLTAWIGTNKKNILVFPFPKITDGALSVTFTDHASQSQCSAKIQIKLTQTDEGIKVTPGTFEQAFEGNPCSLKTAKVVVEGDGDTGSYYTISASAR